MRRRTVLALVGSAAIAVPAPSAAQSADVQREVLAALDTFTEGLRRKDPDMMRGVMEPYTRLTLTRPTQDGGIRVVVYDGEDFIDRVTAEDQPALDERIRRPAFQVDRHLVTVWAEYQVRIEGRVSHCGFDAFHLVRIEGAWKIVNVSDTVRLEGCGEPWP